MIEELKKSNNNWTNWIWQQQNAVVSSKEIINFFPNLKDNIIKSIEEAEKQVKFKITPYMASLIDLDKEGNPKLDDPIWKMTIPNQKLFMGSSTEVISDFDVNWELPAEMINPMLHHKYKDRVVLRIQNNCLSYCMYCFESKRTLDPTPNIAVSNRELLEKSCEYINNNKQINEVILSGGEPLFMSNKNLEEILKKLREIEHIRIVRLHTRVLTHNPFRFDEELINLFDKYDVTCLNVHFTHPKEITEDVCNAMKRLDSAKTRTIVLSHTPLLRGINDNWKVLLDLFMKLYDLKIIPYYLLHAMPDTLGANQFRTSVKEGVELMRQLKRIYSNPAIPEYIIVHKSSKHTVPFELDGTSEFEYHNGYIRFKNYKGEWQQYKEK